jgi:rod shape-determining protein MreD
MKRILLLTLSGILLLSFQATFLSFPPIQWLRPDLSLIWVLYLGFSFSLFSGGILTFLLGFLLDLFSGNAFGLYTLTRPLVFLIAQLFRHRFYWQGFSFQFLFVTLATAVEGLFILLLLTALNLSPLHNLYPSIVTHLLPQSVSTALVTPIFFSLLNRGLGFLENDRRTGLRTEG